MINRFYFLIIGIFFVLAACKSGGEIEQVDIVDLDENFYSLQVHGENWVIENRIEKSGGQIPEVDDVFSTKYCGRSVAVFMLSEDANTAITYGRLYKYLIWDIDLKRVSKTIVTGNVRDKLDDTIISNDWLEVLEKLKLGDMGKSKLGESCSDDSQ